MSGPVFEQYKAALRRGHQAALSGALDDALDAYREAARVVPDRALPLASAGMILHRLDRWSEATAAFEGALRLSPDDEATLKARGGALEERGLRSSAAEDFERLAFALDVAGRAPEAVEVARRAAQLDPSPARTALLERLTRSAERAAALPDASAERPESAPAPSAESPAPEAEDGEIWPAIDLPSIPPPAVAGALPEVETIMTNATNLLDAGDTSAARDLMLRAAFLNRAAGRLDAALDICFQLLSFTPGDPQVHLAIANLQLDRGWTPLATEKIELLRQLTELMGDTQAEADVRGLAAERLRDAPNGVTASR